jgi:hypothetical protein
MAITASVGMEDSAWSVGFCIMICDTVTQGETSLSLYAFLSIRSARMIQSRVARILVESVDEPRSDIVSRSSSESWSLVLRRENIRFVFSEQSI